MTSRLFGVGLAGTAIAPAERRILERFQPWSVILFRRNLEDLDQVVILTEEIRRLSGSPVLCVDQEGGPVDRFAGLLGPSISFRQAAQAGLARRAGALAGEACARLGFQIDLAPVLDRLLPGASEKVLRDRCASSDPESIARAAGEFLEGLHARGVGGCVKHFPGLGRASLDTHKELPLIPEDAQEELLDLEPFRQTMEKARAVMISHAAGPDAVPASLSAAKASGLLRDRLSFTGALFSDDLEMGALSAFGELPERCAAAARAGCDLLFVCSQIESYPDCVEAVAREVSQDRLGEARERLTGYLRHLGRIREASRIPERPIAELAAELRELSERAAGERSSAAENS